VQATSLAYGAQLVTVIVTGRRAEVYGVYSVEGIDKRVTTAQLYLCFRDRLSEGTDTQNPLTFFQSSLVYPMLTITHCSVLAPTGHTLGFMTFAPTKTTSQGME
jgi:hypothetical protein